MSTKQSCALPKSNFPLKFEVESPVHALKLAKKLVTPYKQWTTGAFAVSEVNPDGNHSDDEISTFSPEAEAFCALGALMRVNTKHEDAATKFLQIAAATMRGRFEDDPYYFPESDDIFNLNDDDGRNARAHREVLKMFDLAITLAKKAAHQKGRKA